nr:hypothetical protein [Domibacillus indicus]
MKIQNRKKVEVQEAGNSVQKQSDKETFFEVFFKKPNERPVYSRVLMDDPLPDNTVHGNSGRNSCNDWKAEQNP